MAINQLTTANTFQHWLTATQSLIATANTLTDGNGASFIANTKLDVSGTGSQLNVRNSGSINTLYANNAILTNINILNNVASLNVTSTSVFGGNVQIDGNLNVTGNITLDAVGFNDLAVSGNLSVTGNTTQSNTIVTYGNFATANIVTFVGTANTAIYNRITSAEATALAFSIALG
jgi:hypothetical protein